MIGKTRNVRVGLGLILCLGAAAPVRAAEIRLGAGIQHWHHVDAPKSRAIDRSGRSEFITAQYRFIPLLKGQLDLERFPRSFAGSSRSVLAPQAHIVAGGWIYGSLGAGIFYSDGQWASRPFTQVRVGLDVPVFPRVRLNAHMRYQNTEWTRISLEENDFKSNLWSLGVAFLIRI